MNNSSLAWMRSGWPLPRHVNQEVDGAHLAPAPESSEKATDPTGGIGDATARAAVAGRLTSSLWASHAVRGQGSGGSQSDVGGAPAAGAEMPCQALRTSAA